MILGVCHRLEELTGIDKLVFQMAFVFGLMVNPATFWVYIILAFFV